MKAKIISKTYYIAKTEDGKIYSVDINNPIIKNAFENNIEIEGDIHREEKQDRYTNGEYARSYTIIERFVPKKEKIRISDDSKKMEDFSDFKSNVEIVPEIKKPERSKPQHISLPKKNEIKQIDKVNILKKNEKNI